MSTIVRALDFRKPVGYLANVFYALQRTLKPHRTCTREGIKYRLDLNELIDFSIYRGWGWERETIEFLKHNLNAGDVVVEVGANVGAHTLLISKLVGYAGAVYAFEPTSYARNKLVANVTLNPSFSGNAIVRSELVTNGQSHVKHAAIRSSWKIDGIQREAENVTVGETTIDAFANLVGLTKFSLLKIDVDGYDYKVLQGAAGVLDRFRPVVFVELCEYALQEQGDSIRDIFGLLEKLNYRSFLENGAELSLQFALDMTGLSTSINGVFRPK